MLPGYVVRSNIRCGTAISVYLVYETTQTISLAETRKPGKHAGGFLWGFGTYSIAVHDRISHFMMDSLLIGKEKMNARLPLFACLLGAIAMLLAGCSAPSDGRDQTTSSSTVIEDWGPPVAGGHLVQAMLGDASNLIPLLSSDSGSSTITGSIFVAPLRYNRDLDLELWAAESYEVLEEGRLLRFKLREDVRWFDGEPLTAEDVEFTYKLMTDPKTPTAYAGDYEQIKEFKRTGRYTFEVRYEEPYARAMVTWAHSILPKHALEGEDLLNTKYSREPLGAGAYKLKEWVPGRHIVLEANEDYFLGRPYIDELVYRIIPDQATQFLELKAGNLDMLSLGPMDYIYQTTGPDWDANFIKYNYLSSSYTYLGYNLEHPIFSDRRVRRALAHAIDREEIVRGVLLGLGEPAVGPFMPGTWAARTDLKPFAFDPAKARALLADAGWKDSDGDGVLDKDGRPFSFTLMTNQGNSQRIRTATIIQYRLAQIGVQVEVRTVEWATFLNEFIDKGRFDAVVLAWTIPVEADPYSVWHSDNAKDGGLNFGRFRNAELDRLVEAAVRRSTAKRGAHCIIGCRKYFTRNSPIVSCTFPWRCP